MDYQVRGHVPDQEHVIPLGVADVKRQGEDVTIVATSSMVRVALAAADLLADDGIRAEIIDPRTLVPLDAETLVRSAEKTGRAIVVDEGHRRYGATAELASVVGEGAFYHLDAPIRRLGAMDVPIPFSPALEDVTVPMPDVVAEAARDLCGRGG
jgi:pyruvate dehydrogenase E1 component beta subunit